MSSCIGAYTQPYPSFFIPVPYHTAFALPELFQVSLLLKSNLVRVGSRLLPISASLQHKAQVSARFSHRKSQPNLSSRRTNLMIWNQCHTTWAKRQSVTHLWHLPGSVIGSDSTLRRTSRKAYRSKRQSCSSASSGAQTLNRSACVRNLQTSSRLVIWPFALEAIQIRLCWETSKSRARIVP